MQGMNFHQILEIIQHTVSLLGILIILCGTISALFQYLRYIFFEKSKKENSSINTIRLNLGRVIVLGLEFIIAADLINTTTTPDYYSVGILASIVVIRTLLSYTLNKEILSLSKIDK
ncbi:MAG TPA: DUF1622 domain-containing protein [Gammaproteobacteria bacterium]|nr:DUF1622 domain-containing protein [Gammaproteobacteria bacterium]